MPSGGERSRVLPSGRTVQACQKHLAGRLNQLEGLVLLGGSVRESRLAASIDRSILELPIDVDRTILAQWYEQTQDIAAHLSRDRRLPVRFVLSQGFRSPAFLPSENGVRLEVQHDPSTLRGTGGLLRDIAQEYDDDACLLVANACQILLRPLLESVLALSELDGDVVMLSHAGGTPCACFLVRCGALRSISPLGYVDFKEQALPAIARKGCVRVAEREEPTGLPAGTSRLYVAALRAYHLQARGVGGRYDPYREDWEAVFSLVEEGAEVEEGATIHDSVVLKGARVGRGATAARSVVCGHVASRRTVVDRIVEGRSRPLRNRRGQR